MYFNKFFKAINDISPTSWDALSSGKMDLEIQDEMRGLISGNAEAAQIARQRLLEFLDGTIGG